MTCAYGRVKRRGFVAFTKKIKFVDFARKEKDAANPLKPSGYWVNNIMVSKVENNPFAGQAFDPTEEPEPEDPETPAGGADKHDDLPFD